MTFTFGVLIYVLMWYIVVANGEIEHWGRIVSESFEQLPNAFNNEYLLNNGLITVAIIVSIPLGIIGLSIYLPKYYAYSQTE